MSVMAFAITNAYAPFTIATILMFGIGLLEGIGLGIGSIGGADGHLDLHAHVHADVHSGAEADGHDASFLQWLGLVEDMPILIWFTSLLACFSISGFVIQQACEAISGTPFTWPVACAIAAPTALALNLLSANALHRILPKTETTAITPDEIVGLRGTVIECDAAPGRHARAKVVDRFGQAHHVSILPHEDVTIPKGSEVLLVRRDTDTFYAITEDVNVLGSID